MSFALRLYGFVCFLLSRILFNPTCCATQYYWFSYLWEAFARGSTVCSRCIVFSSLFSSDVNKDWTCKDKDKDQAYKDQDNGKDFTYSYLLQVAAKPTIANKQQQWTQSEHSQIMTVKPITRMHGSAIRCVRSHSRSIWNIANLTPL